MKTTSLAKFVFILMAAVLVLGACAPAVVNTPAPTAVPVEPTAAPATVYRIASDATWPPFESVNESTKAIEGFDVDLLTAIAAEAGFQFEIVNVGWDALLTGMAQCQYDGAISAMTITEERALAFNFSDPYLAAGQVVSINKETTDIKGVADLVGKKIGVQIGTTGTIESEKIEGAEVKTYDSVDLAFQDLINKQVDAVVADYPTAVSFVGVNSDKLMTIGDVFTSEQYGIAVCKTNTELLGLLNKGLTAVKAKGLIPELEKKWLAAPAQ
jgi:polar amino acid transport system substrate-binding protein